MLGKLCGVLYKRRGKIVSEDMLEGTQTFVIKAMLPVAESFGFANDLRKKTSGTGRHGSVCDLVSLPACYARRNLLLLLP